MVKDPVFLVDMLCQVVAIVVREKFWLIFLRLLLVELNLLIGIFHD